MKHKSNAKRFIAVFAIAMTLFATGSFTRYQVFFPQVTVQAEEAADDQPATDYPRPAENTVLRKGSRGEDVCWLQAALNAATNAGLTVDGDFGGGTEAALIAFQEQQGLTADGIAGAETLRRLDELLNQQATEEAQPEDEPQVTEPAEPRQVKSIFLDYWKSFFLCITDFAANFKEKIAWMASFSGAIAGFVIAIIVAVWVLLVLFKFGDSFEETGRLIRLSNGDWIDELRFVGSSFSITNAMGSFLPGFLKLVGICILLSPAISDVVYLCGSYGTSVWGGIWRALLYGVLRILLSIGILIGGLYLIIELLAVGLAALAFPFLLLKAAFRKLSGSQDNAAIPLTKQFRHCYIKVYNSKVTFGFAMVVLCAVILALNAVPVLMAFELAVGIYL